MLQVGAYIAEKFVGVAKRHSTVNNGPANGKEDKERILRFEQCR